MPSSVIFAGLVATWLAVLVPMAARRRQPMPRPSDAALSGRVLVRPRRREQEVVPMDDTADRPVAEADLAVPRYRRGRGGYDPEAAALAARARYVVRQRIVVALALVAVATLLVAAGLGITAFWFVHVLVDLCLLGYLFYLRRQVREEQSIRARRTARMAGSRWDEEWDDQRWDSDEWESDEWESDSWEPDTAESDGAESGGWDATGDPEHSRPAARRRETGDPGHDEAAGSTTGQDQPAPPEPVDERPALPRLSPSAPPERPRGTVVLERDDEDPELQELDTELRRGYRRAAGQ